MFAIAAAAAAVIATDSHGMLAGLRQVRIGVLRVSHRWLWRERHGQLELMESSQQVVRLSVCDNDWAQAG
jgi:hypothetical protein